MMNIYDNDLNHINEFNLLHGILNPSKHTKNNDSRYYPILCVCMNARRGKGEYKNRIVLDSGFSSTILMIRLTFKLK